MKDLKHVIFSSIGWKFLETKFAYNIEFMRKENEKDNWNLQIKRETA